MAKSKKVTAGSGKYRAVKKASSGLTRVKHRLDDPGPYQPQVGDTVSVKGLEGIRGTVVSVNPGEVTVQVLVKGSSGESLDESSFTYRPTSLTPAS